MPSIFAPLLAFIIVLITFNKWINYKTNKQRKLPPGPLISWPIVGNLPELYRNKPAFRWIDGVMRKLATEIACIRLGDVHVVVVYSPEIAREFLQKNDATFASRPVTVVTDHASHGFLSMALSPWGKQWKKMRQVFTHHLMSPEKLRWLVERRNEEADNLVRYIHNQSINGGVVNIRLLARHYCVNVIRKMTFGKRYFGEIRDDGGPGEAEMQHVEAAFTVLKHLYAFTASDYLPWLRILDIDGHEKIAKEAVAVLNKFHDPIILERMKQWEDGKCRKEPQDLLDVMISLEDADGKPFLSVDEIKAQCAEFLFGIDGPPTAVEWVMAELINHPDILQKAVDEIDKVVGKDRLVQEYDVRHLNYIKACAREAFRLHPVAPFNLPRVSIADATVAGYFIPKGSHVLLSRPGLGRNPRVWEDPLEFKPERHLNNIGSSSLTRVELSEPNLRFITFTTGKRGCVGLALGTSLTVMALGRLLQGFAWSVPPNETSIDLSELPNELFLAKPLHAHAKPRLPLNMYLNITS